MNIIKKLSLFTIVFSMLFLVSCEDDSNDPATSGTLNITINVTNPDSWPTEGTVFCSLDKTWPPSGAPYKSVVLQSAQVQNGQISLVFEDAETNVIFLSSSIISCHHWPLDNFSNKIPIKDYIQIHLDEKWFNESYISTYKNINPSYEDFSNFINSLKRLSNSLSDITLLSLL